MPLKAFVNRNENSLLQFVVALVARQPFIYSNVGYYFGLCGDSSLAHTLGGINKAGQRRACRG